MKNKSIFNTAIGVIIGAVSGASGISILTKKMLQQRDEKVDKFKGYYSLLNRWLDIKQNGLSLETYFRDNGYASIAIYGMGELGTRFYEEMKDSNIEIKYAIDKNAATTDADINVFTLIDKLPYADVIIVTATFAFEDIYNSINQVTNIPVISLDDVVFGITLDK